MAALAALLLSCGGEVDGGGPRIPAAFLVDRVAEATAAVEEARAAPGTDSAARAAALEEAAVRLRQLGEYYLPLLDARGRIAEASRAAATDPGAAAAALDSAESVLLGIVRDHGRHLEGEMREPLERIEDARVALEAGEAGEAAGVLQRLDDHLASIFFRGALVLEGSELDPTPESGER